MVATVKDMAGLGSRTRPRWLGPLPIWASASPVGLRLQGRGEAARPAILRFDHDDFMQEFIDTLNREPGRLGEWLAQPETWRTPMTRAKTAKAESTPSTRVAFLYDKTQRATQAKRRFPSAINLQPFKSLVRPKPVPAPRLEDEQQPLKLYQASQKRHYLISASLIVEEAGLPDCILQPKRQEKVSCVLRRLLPPEPAHAGEKAVPLSQWDEYAFVLGPSGPTWQRIARHGSALLAQLVAGEEQLPMFPVHFTGSCGAPRCLYNGVIPVSRREQWVGAAIGGDAGSTVATTGTTQGLAGLLFQTDVIAPWKLLLEQAEVKKRVAAMDVTTLGGSVSAKMLERNRLLRTTRDEMQTGSWYVLLDFARFLQSNLADLWQVLIGAKLASTLDDGERTLYTLLRSTTLSWQLAFRLLSGKAETEYLSEAEVGLLEVVQYRSLLAAGVGDLTTPEVERWRQADQVPSSSAPYHYEQITWTLAEALVAVVDAGEGLEAAESTFTRFAESGFPLSVDSNWPRFLFPLADPEMEISLPGIDATALEGLSGLEQRLAAVDGLGQLVESLLPAATAAEELIDTIPTGDPRQAWFVVRCVYERPGCGPLFPPLVSAASQRFQMAAFFDPDAPTRPVRIPMPLDITPAGLRKYQKNTGFVLSDMLCGKIKSIRKMTLADLVLSVLPWPFHKDLPEPGSAPCQEGGNSFGVICSLSIPIVTLCALILMMIIVALFDLFFRWIPYLFVCLPIPGLKGKNTEE